MSTHALGIDAIDYWRMHGKREKLALMYDFIRWKCGLLNRYVSVDFCSTRRVVFVCTGNICRSAYAEARFNQLSRGAISVGISARAGRPADESATRVAAARGVDLRTHRTQNIRDLKCLPGDLFVCMEKNHADAVSSLITSKGIGILLLGGLIDYPRISDPYDREEWYFNVAFDVIDSALCVLDAELAHLRRP